MTTMRIQHPIQNDTGMVLISSLLFLAILSIAGTSGYLASSNELKTSSNYRSAKQAFYDAEAGVSYALAGIEAGLQAGTLSLSGSTVTVNFTAPSGFSFDTITTLTKVTGTNYYQFQASGNAGGGKSALDVVFARDPAFQYGVFGEEEVDLKSNGSVYSYDSGTTTTPTPSDTTGDADVGSNTKVIVHNGTNIDGNVGLGETAGGTEAVLASTGTPTISGTSQDVSRVDPDPLGVNGGSLANDFTTYSASNDNATSTGISGTVIDTSGTVTLTGKSGGANFYLTEITLKNGATLSIDASAGPVNIYLTGALEAKNGSNITVSTGKPSDLTIYSNSTSGLVFKHDSDFIGTVYAPNAAVEMKNSATAYGLLWAKTVDIKNSGEFYFDTALKDKWSSNSVSVVSWKDTRY